MEIISIVAVSENQIIGKDNKLIWRLPIDTQFFKNQTNGHVIITGRKNYESIPEKYRPLPNRVNIVVTNQKDYKAPGTIVVHSIDDAITYAKWNHKDKTIFIIGGGEIYKQTIDLSSTVYLTRVHESFEGDVSFPILDDRWELQNEVKHKADEKHAYPFTIQTWVWTKEHAYERKMDEVTRRVIKNKGYDDSCTPNTVDELVELVKDCMKDLNN